MSLEVFDAKCCGPCDAVYSVRRKKETLLPVALALPSADSGFSSALSAGCSCAPGRGKIAVHCQHVMLGMYRQS